jgi:serine protease Do
VRGLSDSEAREASVAGGVLVESVASGSAAADAGIRRGDIILELDGKAVRGIGDFGRTAVGLVKGGKAVLVRLMRLGTRMFVAIEP